METLFMNNTLDQMDLINTYRAFYQKITEYTFFSSAYGILSQIDHMSGHKRSLNKLKMVENISCIFSDHNTMKLEINHKKKKSGNTTNTQRLNNMPLNNGATNQQIKEEIKTYMEIIK